ncbi:hypothetical protein PGT21_034377 [Puccinia graminis f. sp. tritici]|uniref:Metallo-beta-lactamase domain-containing protein n=2 Tax=Puccinia graminis f. sp. tritici TaxID=56615 RepID=E3L1N0_PUCGT|nr:uncharacterized protein PGTG_16042 [Puccinia graminis f. sp. tritici CRL 75-36-700-3]KAA1098359.1 hypothetical protein PGT21_034068 [Puccinia graminis f. sp. tritici]EFP90455.1 hypothetical protein PGTG_16042 [Puccinia graminis f. sp. tritici CRL 75-36-700-3]KAA1101973.1 hypothetical protein PGT21_034377 [Puccinia graminis f. sp. tritici]KAA1125628.1 hypothetical protein PGTUg99_013656 [Puccinia graminis f. sp. tritici]KAA1133817.1 hypothetical protein PGTUg99_022263 [Puccinia graminis f. s
MSDVVIREIVKGTILTFSKPFKRMGITPIGGRSTAIKLSDSSVWILASTPLTDETRDKLDQLGPVKYIAVADIEHTGFTTQYTEAYPDAKVYGPEGAASKLGINVHEWTADKNHNPMEYDSQVLKDEIKSEYFDGFINKDIAFLHVPSKTLVQADLLFNLPANEQYSKSKESPTNFTNWFATLKPDSILHQRFVYNLAAVNKKSMAHSVAKVDQWDFDRIIPCHGDVIETGGKTAWRKAYCLYFDDIKNGKFPGIGTSKDQ